MKSIKWRVIVILALVATSVLALVPRSVKQRVYNAQSGQMRDTTVRRVPIKLGLDLRGGVHLALEVDESLRALVGALRPVTGDGRRQIGKCPVVVGEVQVPVLDEPEA